MIKPPSEIIQTSLGNLSFQLLEKQGITTNTPHDIVSFPTHANLPNGMTVQKLTAILLSISPKETINQLHFNCSWDPAPGVKGDPESGEGFDAESWQVGNFIVTVGTEDCDFLSARLPQCNFTENDYPVHLLPFGIEIEIPIIRGGSNISLHFIVAENPFPEPVQTSSWFAMGINHQFLLSQTTKKKAK